MRIAALVAVLGVAATLLPRAVAQQPSPAAGDWPMYRHDLAGTGFSPLTQVDPSNVGTLAQAWIYRLQSTAPPPAGGRGGGALSSEATPIVVG
ncbi:MAG TPA: hypothetical protein VEU08_04445, partial [Vicinamibacterales bacterium]|nr:hypothetical protein [Vicinamibacterales bacterium]